MGESEAMPIRRPLSQQLCFPRRSHFPCSINSHPFVLPNISEDVAVLYSLDAGSGQSEVAPVPYSLYAGSGQRS